VAELGDVRPDRGGVRLAALVPMTGIIATLAAVAVIATLMDIGIRMKLPPPDPDWRQHLPSPVPWPPRWWVVLWVSRYAFLLAGVVAAASG
jgi:hypothetical protein